MIKKISGIFIGVLLTVSAVPANAQIVKLTGKVVRTLSGPGYGGCMISVTGGAPAPCPTNGWVSLDCEGAYSNKSVGERSYASAVVATSMDKQVSIEVDTDKRHTPNAGASVTSGYCVAQRLDVIY